MREILFRGKCIRTNEWVYGSLLQEMYNCYISKKVDQTIEAITQIFVHKETIGQFTGLTDKKGVKIFEGDVIKTDCHDIITVSYGIQVIDAFETIGFNLSEFIGSYEDAGKAIRLQNSIEIIGNIHELK